MKEIIGCMIIRDKDEIPIAIGVLQNNDPVFIISIEDIITLKEVLAPFAHPDLSKLCHGNTRNDDSIVFQRDNAILKIGDFKRASKLYNKKLVGKK